MRSSHAVDHEAARRCAASLTLLLVVSCSDGEADDPAASAAAGAAATGSEAGGAAGADASVAGDAMAGAAGASAGGQAGDDGAGGADAGGAGAGAGGDASAREASAADTGGAPMLLCGELGGVCGGCIRDKCCELAELCTVDADCACMAACIGSASLSGTQQCLDSCGLDGSPPGFADLAVCADSACPDGSDECNAPAGFAPPPDVAASAPASSAGIGSGTLADCSFGAPDPTGAVLQLQSADASVCVRIERRDDGPGSMANTSWTLLSMRVGPPGEVALIDAPADLCWYSSHHNFNDWAHAWSGSRHYDVKTSLTGHGATPTYTLHVFEQGPLAGGSCSPTAEGTCPIATMDLLPAP